jgi:protein disulfide-isomerase
LETLPRVVSNPPKLTPKSTIGTFENIFFQIRNFGTYHPYYSFVLLLGAVAMLFYILRNPTVVRHAISRSSSGYFHLPINEKAAFRGGGKAD